MVGFGDFHQNVLIRRTFLLESRHADSQVDQTFHQVSLAVVAARESEDHLLPEKMKTMDTGAGILS